MRRTATARLKPWAGLVGPPLAWMLHHQLGSDLNFADCARGDGPLVAAVGAAALAVTLLSGWLSWRGWRASDAGEARPTDRFVAILGMMSAALLGLTIAVQVLAGLIVPACFR
jgi:hypothetical protein